MDLRAVVGLARPFTMLAPVLGVACGATNAAYALGIPYDLGRVGLAALSAMCANAASNAWNQAFDADIDRVNKPTRPIPEGRATVRGALTLGHACAALSVLVAVLHASLVGHVWFLACVGFGIFATWSYSAPPLRTKRSLVGALATIAIPRGFLVPVAGWAVLAAPKDAQPFALGLVPGLFVLGAAATKDFADVEGDRAHGCRTLPIVLGASRAASVVAPFLVLPFALYPLLSFFHVIARPTLVWGVLALILSMGGAITARALLRDPQSLATERNHPAWRGMYLLMLANQIGVALVYALA